jgi:flagellin
VGPPPDEKQAAKEVQGQGRPEEDSGRMNMSMLRINNNISALNTQRNLNVNSFNLGKTLQKLSSGFRINVAADGPADLVISESLRSQIGGIKAALRNCQEASNLVGIAEGALNEVNNLLVSMRALAVHAANVGVVTAEQIAADQAEFDNAAATITRIGTATRFAGQAVFSGAAETFHIGEGAILATDEVTLAAAALTAPAPPAGVLAGAANAAIIAVDAAITAVAVQRATLGAFQKNTLQTNINSLSVSLENVTATESYIRDANMAEETSAFTKGQILVQAGVSVLAQANVLSQSVLQLLQ